MTPYISLLAFALLIGPATGVLNRRSKQATAWSCGITAIVLIAFSGLRALTVGTDTASYRSQFERQQVREDEWGYQALVSVAHLFDISFRGFLVFVAALITISVAFAAWRYSELPLVTLYLYLCMGMFAMSLTGIRQTIAVAITVIGIVFLMSGRRMLFIIAIGIAYTVHNTSLVLIPLLLLWGRGLTRRGALWVLSGGLLLATQVSLVGAGIRRLGLDKYDVYLRSDADQINLLVLVVAATIPILAIVFWPNEHEESDTSNGSSLHLKHSFFFVLSVANLVVTIYAFDIPMMTRMSYYFLPWMAVLIPNVIARVNQPSVRTYGTLATLALATVMFVQAAPGSSLGHVPYEVSWSAR